MVNKNLSFFFFLIFLLVNYSWSLNYYIVDSSLYKMKDNQQYLITKNVIDFFYYQNNIFFIIRENEDLAIFKFSKTKFLPFFNKERIQKIATIKNDNRYIASFTYLDKIFILTNKSVYLFDKGLSLKKYLDLLDNFYLTNTFKNNLVIKNTKNNLYFVYNISDTRKPIFTIDFDYFIQGIESDNYYILMGLNHLYDNEYNLLVKIKDKKNSTLNFLNLLSQKVKVYYDSTFYLIPINDNYILFHQKDKLTLYQLINYSLLKPVYFIESYYSYFVNNYLFTIDKSNLSVYYFENNFLTPLFSIPRVNFIFYFQEKVYYLFYDENDQVWKYTYISFDNKLPVKSEEEIIFYNLPEEVIPVY